ncbi:MAG: methionyl-tRNA formyltransferase [Steroidobacteraceae bacterium]
MSTSLRIVYAGTPDFAVPALQALRASAHQVVAVYTQPDRPAGRGRVLTASPVKACAQTHGIAVEQPVNFRDPASVEQLRSYAPDVMVVAAYGLILPQVVLDTPRYGCINIHGSLLPRWRGAAPIQRAILAGDAQTGITIMRMEAGLDTGPMIEKQGFAIDAEDTAASVHDRLASLGAILLLQTLADLPVALAKTQVQPEAGVTYAKKLSKEEAALDWSLPAAQLDRQVRAFNPWPIAETRLHGEQLRVWRANALAATHAAAPGTVVKADVTGIQVACGEGVLNITQLQQSGRKTVAAADFIKSHSMLGVQLGVTTGTSS